MEGGKFDLDKMKKYINNIEAQMGHTNPAGLQLIAEELEPAPVSKLKEVLLDVLDGYDERNALTWNSSAGDQAMLASLKDIVERMAQLTKQNVAWRPARAGQPLPWEVKDPKEQKAALSVRSAAPASGLATFIIGDPAFYCAARVLGAEASTVTAGGGSTNGASSGSRVKPSAALLCSDGVSGSLAEFAFGAIERQSLPKPPRPSGM